MMDGLHCTLQLVRENMNALIFLLIWRMLIQVPLIGKHYRSEAKYRIIKKIDYSISYKNTISTIYNISSRRGHTPLEDALFHKKNALHGNFDNENLTKVIEILRKHGENKKYSEANLAQSISGSIIIRKERKN